MKVIIAHPSKQHSFYSAISLNQSGDLYKYITTVYSKKGSLTSVLSKLANKKDSKKISSHYCQEINDDQVIQFYEADYIISLILNRFPKLAALREKHRQYVADKFGRKVAQFAIKHSVDAVIMYDSTATKCFKILQEQAPNIKKILDVSIASRPFIKMTFEEDMKLTGEDELKNEFPLLWNDQSMKNMYDEILYADAYFAPSDIVKRSLVYCGALPENIHIVPYGVDIQKFPLKTYSSNSTGLKLIYVGQVSYRKGIHHLLKVIKEYYDDSITVDLVGSYSKESEIYKKYYECKNITFSGFITHDQLAKKYSEADVFVFPTLGEGYGMVVLEAMSCGLPIICSDHAGGNDPIVDYYNGVVFQAGNDQELKNSIDWFITHKNEIKELGMNARKTAEELTWTRYYVEYEKELHKILE